MKHSYTVGMKCTVYKSVTLEDCPSEEEAKKDPWAYATDEMETDMLDWEVLSVESDE